MQVFTEKIESLMTKELITVTVNDSLHYASGLFDKHHLRHLPVVENGKLVGMLSLTDLMRLSFGNTYGVDDSETDETLFEMLTIRQVMNSKPHYVSSNQSIREVAEKLTKEEFHALPVVDDEKLVGIVTTTDIIKYLLL